MILQRKYYSEKNTTLLLHKHIFLKYFIMDFSFTEEERKFIKPPALPEVYDCSS